MINPYIKQFPELFKGKTVLYVHGFGSSGQSGTVTRIREALPSARVIAPDLPVHPQEALALLRATCEREPLRKMFLSGSGRLAGLMTSV